MSEREIDPLTMAMPIIIIPVERKPKKVLMATSIILVLTLAIALVSSATIGYFYGGQVTEEAMPAKESEMGGEASILNLIYFLFMIFIVTIGIIMLIKYRKINLLKAIMTIVVLLLIFTFTQIMVILYQAYVLIGLYSLGVYSVVHFVPFIIYVSWFVVMAFSAIYILSIVRLKYLNSRNAILMLNAVWAAVWLGWNSGILTPIVILVGLAIYDLYSVFRGPLRNLTELLVHEESGEGSLGEHGVLIGLGDIFFYSFAIAYSYAVLNILEVVIIAIILYGGAILTFVLLLRFDVRALPALPIPILTSVAFILLFLYVI